MKREGSDKTDCLCNNCSQGRTALAEDLLFLHEIISNEAKQHKVSEA